MQNRIGRFERRVERIVVNELLPACAAILISLAITSVLKMLVE